MSEWIEVTSSSTLTPPEGAVTVDVVALGGGGAGCGGKNANPGNGAPGRAGLWADGSFPAGEVTISVAAATADAAPNVIGRDGNPTTVTIGGEVVTAAGGGGGQSSDTASGLNSGIAVKNHNVFGRLFRGGGEASGKQGASSVRAGKEPGGGGSGGRQGTNTTDQRGGPGAPGKVWVRWNKATGETGTGNVRVGVQDIDSIHAPHPTTGAHVEVSEMWLGTVKLWQSADTVVIDGSRSARDQFRDALVDRGLNYETVVEVPFVLDTSKATDLNSMFNWCEKLATVPKMDTSNVTNMQYMFSGCSALVSVPDMDTGNVTNMNGTFQLCSKLKDGAVRCVGKNAGVDTRKMIVNSGLTRLPFYDSAGNWTG